MARPIHRMILLLFTAVSAVVPAKAEIAFLETRPQGANFVRPEMDQVMGVSPPGFSWWRAAPKGEATCRLQVLSASGQTVYEAEGLPDNVHVPEDVFPTGRYTWRVEACDHDGVQRDAREFGAFRIAADAVGDPWIPPCGTAGKGTESTSQVAVSERPAGSNPVHTGYHPPGGLREPDPPGGCLPRNESAAGTGLR